MSSLLHWDVARPSCLESAKDPELLRWGDVSRSVCVSEGDGGDLPEQSPLSDPFFWKALQSTVLSQGTRLHCSHCLLSCFKGNLFPI